MTKKKKIGIVTITNDGYNFGNRLQNYALQMVLERMGYEVETLNRPIRGNQRNLWKRKKMVLHYLIPFRRQIVHIKAGKFFFWNQRYIHWSKIVAIDENLPLLAKQYDYFVAGSDQIWNPEFDWGTDPYMFLQFAEPKQRVAYAPSIGLDEELKEPYRTLFKMMWQNWHALSCREQSGSQTMSNLIEQRVPCLLDPTLLLSRDDWMQMSNHSDTPKKYIFLYILGILTEEYKQYVDELAQRTGCSVVDIMNDMRYAGCSPSRFVALLQHADWVVADSYHAYVFSIIFHRPFTFINRVGCGIKMNSRMKTLVEKMHIFVPHWENITEIVPLNWKRIDEVILKEQQLSISFLKSALK